MASFAIVRQDGEVDIAEGNSVADVAARYGWPGNGDIVAYDSAQHASNVRHRFTSPDDQTAEWEKASAPKFVPAKENK